MIGFTSVGDKAPLCIVLLVRGEPFSGGRVVGEEEAEGLLSSV